MSKIYPSKKLKTFVFESFLWIASLSAAATSVCVYHFPQWVDSLFSRPLLDEGSYPRLDLILTFITAVVAVSLFALTSFGNSWIKSLKAAFREYHYLTTPTWKQTLSLVGFVAIASAVTGYLVSILDLCLSEFFISKIISVNL